MKVEKAFNENKNFKKPECYVSFVCCPSCGAEISYKFFYEAYPPSVGQPDFDEFELKGYSQEKKVKLREYSYKTQETAGKNYLSFFTHNQTCPVCGAELRFEPGFFEPCSETGSLNQKMFGNDVNNTYSKRFFSAIENWWSYNGFERMAILRERADREAAEASVAEYAGSVDLPVVPVISKEKVKAAKEDSEQLKEYVLKLIKLESNIHALEQRLTALYSQRRQNDRSVVAQPYSAYVEYDNEKSRLEAEWKKCEDELRAAGEKKPQLLPIKYPPKPAEPILDKPGLFDRKRITRINEAKLQRHAEAMEAYNKKVAELEEQEANRYRNAQRKYERLKTEMKEKISAAKANLENLIDQWNAEAGSTAETPAPCYAISRILDEEIKQAETTLKELFESRNALYGYDIIFIKYRNLVALSSFYEYLMAGRCSALEGANGAYNMYESDCKMELVISQLDQVISALDKIQQNQFMIYSELQSINKGLHALNRTMATAVASLARIETNTGSMNEYMARVAENSDVIAHNTAVTAYYAKINAELTDALGYMVAFK